MKNYADTTFRLESWDNFTGIPHAAPSDNDVTHFSWANDIYDWAVGLFYTKTEVDAINTSMKNYVDDTFLTSQQKQTQPLLLKNQILLLQI